MASPAPDPPAPAARQALVALLRDEATELRRLLPLLDEQELALRRADTAALLAVIERQEPVLRRIVALEGHRRAISRRLAREYGVEADAVTLSRLLATGAATAGLPALRDELRQLVDALLARHRRNTFLVERSLRWIDRLVEHLAAALGLVGTATYAAGGHRAPAVASLQLLDRRA